MSAAPLRSRQPAPEPQLTTLLELVGTVAEITDDEQEIVATVLELLRSNRVKLCGNFRGCSPEDLS